MLHYVGCQMLWRASHRIHEHASVPHASLEQLCHCLRSREMRVKALAAVVVWQFAQHPPTLKRLPFQIAVRAPSLSSFHTATDQARVARTPARPLSRSLAHPLFVLVFDSLQVPALLGELLHEEDSIVRFEASEGGLGLTEMLEPSTRDEEPIGLSGQEVVKRSGRRLSELQLKEKINQLQFLQDLRCEATMGTTLSELRMWVARSLSVLLEVDEGRSVYIKVMGQGSFRGGGVWGWLEAGRLGCTGRTASLAMLLRAGAGSGPASTEGHESALCAGAHSLSSRQMQGHEALLRLFKQPDNASGEAAKLIFLSVMSRGDEAAQRHACKLLLDEGLDLLVQLAIGRRPGESGAPVDW